MDQLLPLVAGINRSGSISCDWGRNSNCYFQKTGDSGMVFRSKSSELSSYVLDSLRGLKESIQYSTGEQRLEQLNQHTDQLSKEEAKMKRRTGQNMAVTNTAILVFDLVMLLVAALLYHNQMIAFDGVLIPVVAMMSSFRSGGRPGKPGQYLTKYFRSRQPCTGYSG